MNSNIWTPEVVMMVGIPASGKSTFARKLAEGGYHWHSSDNLRVELNLKDGDPKDNAKLFKELHRRIKEDLRNGISCVFDATNLSRKRRAGFVDELGNIPCKKTCCLMLADIDECKRRNSERKVPVPEYKYAQMLANFDPPYCNEGWDEIEIETSGTTEPFALSSMKGFEQDNPHHSHDLYTHTRKVVAGVIQADPGNAILEKAAMYHDIGKMRTKVFTDSNGNPTPEAHFYGHAGHGAYMFLLSENASGNITDPESAKTALYIASLIAMHMTPSAWEGKVPDKIAKRWDDEFMHDLMILHEADKKAHV